MVGCAEEPEEDAPTKIIVDKLADAERKRLKALAEEACFISEDDAADPFLKAKRLQECEQERERNKGPNVEEQQAELSREWRERRSLQDPEQFTALQEQCESSVSIKRDDDRRLIQVTDCMRLSWK